LVVRGHVLSRKTNAHCLRPVPAVQPACCRCRCALVR
jgi:hypothetical protein